MVMFHRLISVSKTRSRFDCTLVIWEYLFQWVFVFILFCYVAGKMSAINDIELNAMRILVFFLLFLLSLFLSFSYIKKCSCWCCIFGFSLIYIMIFIIYWNEYVFHFLTFICTVNKYSVFTTPFIYIMINFDLFFIPFL